MKILVIPTWYENKKDPNSGVFIKEQIIEFSKNNEVVVYFPYDDYSSYNVNFKIEDDILVYRSKWIKSFIPIIPNVINRINFFINFLKILKDFKPDFIHAHVSTQAGSLARFIYKILKIPYIVTEHCPKDLLIKNQREYIKTKKVFNDSFKNIGVSQYICDQLKELGDLEYINNGVKVDFFKQEIDEFDLNLINIVVVASFYNKDIKGIKYLLESLELINDSFKKKINIHIIGEGQFKEYYIKYAEDLNLKKIVRFYGYLNKNETLNFISRCDFLVSSSLEETFGIAIGEALMLGKPVIITKSGGPEEFVNDEVGMLIQTKDSESLATAIVKMVKNYKNYDSNKIKNHAIKNISMERSLNRYNEVFAAITKGEK